MPSITLTTYYAIRVDRTKLNVAKQNMSRKVNSDTVFNQCYYSEIEWRMKEALAGRLTYDGGGKIDSAMRANFDVINLVPSGPFYPTTKPSSSSEGSSSTILGVAPSALALASADETSKATGRSEAAVAALSPLSSTSVTQQQQHSRQRRNMFISLGNLSRPVSRYLKLPNRIILP